MKIIKILLLVLLNSTFSFGQGYFDLEEVNENSLIYSQCKERWTQLNKEYIKEYTKIKDSINNLTGTIPRIELEFYRKEINSIIEKQSAIYMFGWGGNDFDLGLLYDLKQDSAIQQFMKTNKLSYIFGIKDDYTSFLFYKNENLNFTSQVKANLSKNTSAPVSPKTKLKFAFANLPNFIEVSSFFVNDTSSKMTQKKATKLVAEEYDIDFILKKEEMKYNIIEIILYGSEKLDVTELIMAKYNNQPPPITQLKLNPTIAGVQLNILIDAVAEIHPDYQREKKILRDKYKKIYDNPTNPKYSETINFDDAIEKLRNKYIDIIKAEITKESIAMSKKLNYDVLISVKSPGYGNLFDHYEEIHIAKEHILTEKVYQIFVDKYKGEN